VLFRKAVGASEYYLLFRFPVFSIGAALSGAFPISRIFSPAPQPSLLALLLDSCTCKKRTPNPMVKLQIPAPEKKKLGEMG
jgi:hypothetical protein